MYPQQILFASDSCEELEEAVQAAGMSTALAVRSVDGIPGSASYPTIHSFDEIFPE
jgi:methionine salvage enolase-phosphatase E1